jgi:hypothetical protein
MVKVVETSYARGEVESDNSGGLSMQHKNTEMMEEGKRGRGRRSE